MNSPHTSQLPSMLYPLLKATAMRSLALACIFCTSSLLAKTYHIGPSGSKQNPGTQAKPFSNLSDAVELARPGDTIIFLEGVYEEPQKADGLKGTAARPIRIVASDDAEVLLDGTRTLNTKWTRISQGVYQAQLKHDIWQLFDDRHALDLARWPNASIHDKSLWDAKASMRHTDRKWNIKKKAFDGKTRVGVIHDHHHKKPIEGVNIESLAQTGIDFTGALAVLNIGHWLTWTRPITQHKAGQNHFSYDASKTKMNKFLDYYLYGLAALDAEGEWWFDAKEKTLTIKTPKGKHPKELLLRAKVRDYNLKVTNCAHLEFHGLDFFGTTFGIAHSHNIVIDQSHLRFPSTHKFVLGNLNWVNTKKPFAEKENNLTFIINDGDGPFHNWVTNSTFEWPNSPAISILSPGSGLDNCLLHSIEWDVNSSGGCGSLPGGPQTTVRNCTIHTTGNSEGIRLGQDSNIVNNHLYNTSLLQHDGSAINVGTHSQQGTIVRRNWVHDTNRQAIRLDSTGSAFGSNAAVTENVFFRVSGGLGGNKFKGDYQFVSKNTAFDSFMAIPYSFGNTDIHNENSLVSNNLADHLVEWNLSNRVDGIPATMVHNLRGDGIVRTMLRDPDHLDFRPKPSSKAIIDAGRLIERSELKGKDLRLPEQPFLGKAPDIGAYEVDNGNYWIPGFRHSKASTPVPPDGAHTVRANADLMWLQGRNASGHEVYFSSSSRDLQRKTSPRKKFLIANTKDPKLNIVAPPTLIRNATYYWRVDAISASGVRTSGDVWSFKVEATPSKGES